MHYCALLYTITDVECVNISLMLYVCICCRVNLLAIENPDMPEVDMGRNSYIMPKIRRSFEHGYQVCMVYWAYVVQYCVGGVLWHCDDIQSVFVIGTCV